MSSVRRTFIPNIFLHQCCQPSFHNFSVMRQKAQPDKKNLHDNLPHTQTHKNTGPTNGLPEALQKRELRKRIRELRAEAVTKQNAEVSASANANCAKCEMVPQTQDKNKTMNLFFQIQSNCENKICRVVPLKHLNHLTWEQFPKP